VVRRHWWKEVTFVAGLLVTLGVTGAQSVQAATPTTSTSTTTSTTTPTSTTTGPAPSTTAGSSSGASCAPGGDGLASASYTLVADAEPVLLTVLDGQAPLVPGGVDLLDLSPVSAQSELDSLQQGTAFAGSPDFGSFVDSLPGTVSGLLSGAGPPLPAVPGTVASSSNVPTDQETLGPYEISAKTSSVESQAAALVGASASTGLSGAEATADTVINPDCSVTSTATSHISLINLGTLMDLGDISTTTTVTEQPGGQPVISTTMSLGTFTLPILGPNGLTDKGFTVAGLTVPSPVQTIFKALSTALGSTVNLQYLPATTTTQLLHSGTITGEGVESAALKMTFTPDVPTQGKVPVSLIVGRTFVSVDNAAQSTGAADSGSGSDLGVTGASTDSGSLGSGVSGLSTSDLSGSLGSGSTGTGSTGSTSTQTGTGIPSGSSAQSLPSLGRLVSKIGPSGESLYLILVLGGLAALGGSQLLRLLAIRLKLAHS
jgi:hypothetical protein